ncbi:MAG TPA: SRPBCC family protein [Acidimicrobiales bacterium]|nr:SRPBCC family protein [Acidimicrobiales bacterium]
MSDRIEQSAAVAASPEEVYAVIADIARRPEWLTELRKVEPPPGPVEVGTRFSAQPSMLLHHLVGHSEVVRAEPGHALAEEIHVGARFLSEWELVPAADGGTVVRHCMTVDFPGGPLSRLERWVMRRRVAAMQKKSLAALRVLLSR